MTRTSDCLIALGSNRGPRREHLRFALRALAALPKTTLVRNSSFYDNPPAAGMRQPRYLNAVARVRTGLTPMGLLVELKRLEALAGRRPGPRWGSRALDCDLLFHGESRLRGRFLHLPHPRALKRAFVLAPLAEIAPRWTPPVRPRRTAAQWLERLPDAALKNVKMT